jgi:hypothetical protein
MGICKSIYKKSNDEIIGVPVVYRPYKKRLLSFDDDINNYRFHPIKNSIKKIYIYGDKDDDEMDDDNKPYVNNDVESSGCNDGGVNI